MSNGRPQIHSDRSIDTIQGAIDELRGRYPGFEDFGPAEVKIGSLKLPEFISLDLVVLVGPLNPQGDGWAIGMPSSSAFTACRAITGGLPETYPIARLDGAVVDEHANVTLADDEETRIFNVRLIPTAFSQGWTEKEWQVLRLVLASMNAEMDTIDYAKLPALNPPPIKWIKGYIDDRRRSDPSIPTASYEFIRTTLMKVGMRRPRHGGRAA